MQTYTTLDGRVLDLTDLNSEEQAYFERCYQAYKEGMAWTEFGNRLLFGEGNPLLHDGQVTRDVWGTPVFQAVRDMEDRLGIQQRKLIAEQGDDLGDPIEDEWIPASEAAERKGVTVPGLHKAIARGDVIARPAKPGGSWTVVSVRSLKHWHPDPVRQSARKRSGEVK